MWASPGALLGLIFRLLEPPGAHFWPPRAYWGSFLACCDLLGLIFGVLGPPGSSFLASWGHFGAILEQFWPFGPPGKSFSSLLGVLFEDCARPATRSKTPFEITRQKIFRDRCTPEAHQDAGSVAGLGAPAPLEIRPPSLSEARARPLSEARCGSRVKPDDKPNVYRR